MVSESLHTGLLAFQAARKAERKGSKDWPYTSVKVTCRLGYNPCLRSPLCVNSRCSKTGKNLSHLGRYPLLLYHRPLLHWNALVISLFRKLKSTLHIAFIHFPHLLVRATSEWFLPVGGTFRVILANESHWLQPMLVLTVHWWPTPLSVGELLVSPILFILLNIHCKLHMHNISRIFNIVLLEWQYYTWYSRRSLTKHCYGFE